MIRDEDGKLAGYVYVDIALYGVAVQTGVVMVVYPHEALNPKLQRGPG